MPASSFHNLTTDKHYQDNPLVSHLETFAKSLMEDGYADLTLRSKLWVLADFGRWLRLTGCTVRDLDERLIEEFLNYKKRGYKDHLITFKQFLDHLRKCGSVPGPKPRCEKSPLADILGRYERYLRSERGLVTSTVVNYQAPVRKFLVERFDEGPFLVAELTSSDISRFVLRHVQTMSSRRAQLVTTALRSFLRFLFCNRELPTDLAASVPSVACWRLSTVPKYLTPEEVERVLGACDRRTATGRRNYAILLLLARLGFRSGEVVTLQLDDIDWRTGEIMIRGKGLFHDRMPLPPDVGEALSCYLRRDRPTCKTRCVFVCMRAPRRGFASPSTVTTIVRSALKMADLHPVFKGAHLFRHSLATSMLRSGATMGEIGEVLRHRAANTTEIYAKVDFDGLRSIAHPWPVGGGQ